MVDALRAHPAVTVTLAAVTLQFQTMSVFRNNEIHLQGGV